MPIFDRFELRSKKRVDYEVWRRAVLIWAEATKGNRWHGRSPHTPELAKLREELRLTRRASLPTQE